MRLRHILVIAIVVVIGISVAIVVLSRFGAQLPTTLGRACAVTTPAGTVALNADQMANAATIAAVGIRRKLPERAIVIALATAFQESRLENITYGDRDSVGLFQQRPSQGWGTVEQIQDPRYAAGKFYSALVRVNGWQDLRVTEAAQRVQRSAYPEAYQKWSDESAVLAEALAGRVTSAVTCSNARQPAQRGDAAVHALGNGLRLDWGNLTETARAGVLGITLAAAQEQRGWQLAHWLVAHSTEKNVERVSFADQEWTAASGQWQQIEPADTGTNVVIAEVYRS